MLQKDTVQSLPHHEMKRHPVGGFEVLFWYECEMLVCMGTAGPFKSPFMTCELPCCSCVAINDRYDKQRMQESLDTTQVG